MTRSEYARGSQRAHWRTGVPKQPLSDASKTTCPVCGHDATERPDGTLRRHKSYAGKAWAWCYGKEES